MSDKMTVGELVYKISGDMDNLKTELKKANTEIEKLKGTMEKADGASGKLTKGFNMLKTAVGAYVSIQGIKAITGQIMELGRQASEVDQLRTSFDRLANEYGLNSQEILNDLKRLSVGTITTKDLVVSANRAMVLGVATSTEEFGELMEISRLRARDMGISTQQAFDNIVTGIGRNSPLILDNLGIVIKAEEAYQMYATSLGKTVEQLTQAEQREAVKYAVIEQGNRAVAEAGQLNLSYAEQMQQMTVTVQELRTEIGTKLLPTLANLLNWINEAIGTFTEAGKATQDYQFEIRELEKYQKFLDMEQQKLADGTARLSDEQIRSARTALETKKAIAEQQRVVDLLAEATQKGAKRKEAVNTLEREYGDILSKQFGIVDTSRRKIEEYYDVQLKKLGDLQVEYVKTQNDALDPLNEAYEEQRKKVEDVSNSLEDNKEAIEKAKSELESFQRSMLSVIESAKRTREALQGDLEKSFTQFGENIKGNFESGISEFAGIVIDAEQKIEELKASLRDTEDSQRKSEIRDQIKEQEEILQAREGFEERQAQRIESIRTRLEEAGINASQVGLDNLLNVKSLEDQIQEERRIADLDAFTRFEEQQTRELEAITEKFITETLLLQEKLEKQKAFEQEATEFLLGQKSMQTKAVDEFANNAIAKYGEMASQLRNAISLQQQLNSLSGGGFGGQNNLPPFAMGGYVGSEGGEVHPGEYVIPPHMVQSFSGLIKNLEQYRTRGTVDSGTTINAPITMNNNVSDQVDFNMVNKNLAWEISRL